MNKCGFCLLFVPVVALYYEYAVSSWVEELTAELAKGSKIADTPKGPVEYCEFGRIGDPDAPVLVGIHGSPGGYDQGIMFLKATFPNSWEKFRAISMSRPGFLRTPLDVGKSAEGNADALKALIDHLGIKRIHNLIGASGGCPMVEAFAVRYPDALSSLILCSCGAFSKHFEVSPFERMLMSDYFTYLLQFVSDDMMVELAKLEAEPDGITEPGTSERELLLQMIPTSMYPVSTREDGSWNDIDQYDALPVDGLNTIKTPTLILHGDVDPQIEVEHAYFAHEQISGSELIIVESGGHLLMSHRSWKESVRDQVDAFLNKHLDN